MSQDIERAQLEVFIEQTKQAVVRIVASRFDAIKARLPQPELPAGDEVRVRHPTAHYLKTWPRYFDALWKGEKRAEVRVNDRDYQAGDYLALREYDPHIVCVEGYEDEACSGRWIVALVDGVSDLDAVVAKNVVLLTLAFSVVGDGIRIYDHPYATALGANDPLYRTVCRGEERWSADLLKRKALELRVADLAAVAMEAVHLNPPRNSDYSQNDAWARLRKAFEVGERRDEGGPVS